MALLCKVYQQNILLRSCAVSPYPHVFYQTSVGSEWKMFVRTAKQTRTTFLPWSAPEKPHSSVICSTNQRWSDEAPVVGLSPGILSIHVPGHHCSVTSKHTSQSEQSVMFTGTDGQDSKGQANTWDVSWGVTSSFCDEVLLSRELQTRFWCFSSEEEHGWERRQSASFKLTPATAMLLPPHRRAEAAPHFTPAVIGQSLRQQVKGAGHSPVTHLLEQRWKKTARFHGFWVLGAVLTRGFTNFKPSVCKCPIFSVEGGLLLQQLLSTGDPFKVPVVYYHAVCWLVTVWSEQADSHLNTETGPGPE